MKIAFICQPFDNVDPSFRDSIAIWICEVARRLASSSNVIVYAKTKLWKKATFEEGVYYRFVTIAPDLILSKLIKPFFRLYYVKRPFFASCLSHLGYVLQVAIDLRKQKCDIAHVMNFSQFVPIIRALNPKIKIVLHMHCEWLTQLDRAMISQRLRKTDLVIGCSEYITTKIHDCFPQKRCQTIYNGVDVNYFVRRSNHNMNENDGRKRLLYVGRISPEKGLHVLLDAFQKVLKHYPQAKLDIVGPEWMAPREYLVALNDDEKMSCLASFYDNNPYRSYLAHLQKLLPPYVLSHVTFAGHVTHLQLLNHYHDADVYIQPSFSDAFPLPVLEAMANEIPVVATRVGGIPEAVIDVKTGLLVAPDDTGALAKAILHLLSNKDLRILMGKAARKRAVDLFSWEKVAENLFYQYKDIGKNHK
jgi:glycosyltransferase involved in cell wall biosynthesis